MSSLLMNLRASLVAWTTFANVRGRLDRTSCFSFEKSISIGLRSGLFGGSNTTWAPADSIANRALSVLWLPRLSITTRSPGCRAGDRNDSQNPVKQTPSIGPSSTIAARVPSRAIACTSVLVSQRPAGTDSTNRSPAIAQPRRRVKFVFRPVSSRNASRSGSTLVWHSNQSARLRATSSRSCSAARCDFF